MFRKFLIAAGVIIAGFVLAYITAFFLFPVDIIEERISMAASSRAGVTFRSDSMRKVFPFGIEAEGVVVGADRNPSMAVYLKRLGATFSPLALFSGKLKVKLYGASGEGVFKGYTALGFGSVKAGINARGLGLGELTSLSGSGLIVSGDLDGDVSLTIPHGGCPEGKISARGKGFEEENISYMGFAIPLGRVEDAGAEVELGGCKASIKGLWVDGEGLSARITGIVNISTPIEGSPLDLTLELIPKGRFIDESENFFFLKPYQKSTNFYSATIKGTLSRPVIKP